MEKVKPLSFDQARAAYGDQCFRLLRGAYHDEEYEEFYSKRYLVESCEGTFFHLNGVWTEAARRAMNRRFARDTAKDSEK
eukprot:12509854-Prorocentrum_lima.AAC.1